VAYTLSSMQTEVYARGFSYLNDSGAGTARVTRWLNDAMHEIDGKADWPYLQVTVTGTAPLTIADLATVESVTAVGLFQTLQPFDRRDLREWYADLTITGTPFGWYLTGGNVINVFPANTSTTLTVDYYKDAPDLAAAGDAPLMPDQYRMAIVEYALTKAHLDAENEASAQTCRQAGDLLVAEMMTNLLDYQHQSPIFHMPAVGTDN
jgi:hypothetical protein